MTTMKPLIPESEGYRSGLTRTKSNRLDSSKFSKFESSSSAQSSDSESATPNKRHTFTGKLNMARFSQFEQGSDSTDSNTPRIKRNTGTRSNSVKYGSQNVVTEKCQVCQKSVYPMEKITADTVVYHKTCFRCGVCKKCLSPGKYAACKGNVFCLPHFKQNFKLKGNYDFTNNPTGSPTSTPASPPQNNGVSDLDLVDSRTPNMSMDAATLEGDVSRLVETPISATHGEVSESTPSLTPGVVRSSDRPEEAMSLEGGTGSVKSRFERGEVNNPDPTPATKSINIYDAPAERGVAESTPVRREDVVHSNEAEEEVRVTAGGIGNLKSMFEKGGVTNLETTPRKAAVTVGSLEDFDNTNTAHVAESTPVIRTDIVRSSDIQEDTGIQIGVSKSLKSRFETERISNIEEKPKQKIEISVPEETRRYQPPERTASVDVVNASTQLEDPGIKSGQARSLRSLFEKGNVSNVVEKPRPTLEREPKSLDEFKTEVHVSENTPVYKDDIVTSSTPVDEPMKSSISARSLKQKWETGQVERVPEKPKPELERTPQSLDNYSMTVVVSENTPVDRDDIVKSSARGDDYLTSKGGASSLKQKWESGEVSNVEYRSHKADNSPKRFSDYYQTDEQTNGEAEENGEEEEEAQENGVDASWEIKAARAAALEEADEY